MNHLPAVSLFIKHAFFPASLILPSKLSKCNWRHRLNETWPKSHMTASSKHYAQKTALQLINQLNTEASSRFGANLNKKISKALLFWVSEELHFFTPPCCTQTGSAVLAPVRFYRLILAIQNIHTSSDRRKSPAPPDRERDTAWFPQHNYQLPAGSRHTATDTVHLGRSLTHLLTTTSSPSLFLSLHMLSCLHDEHGGSTRWSFL